TVITGFLGVALALLPSSQCAQPSFDQDIAPILKAHCVKCHSGSQPAGELDLGSRKGLVKGGKSGFAMGLLLSRVRSGAMPPGGPRLSETEIGTLEKWVQQDRHWAFQTPLRPIVPRVKSSRLARTPPARTPIDLFLLDALESKGLA